jgi:hypothetical protein
MPFQSLTRERLMQSLRSTQSLRMMWHISPTSIRPMQHNREMSTFAMPRWRLM